MQSKDWFRVHSFTGVVTGLLLFLICWSGTFAVLAQEFDWLLTPEERVAAADTRQSWGQLEAAVLQAYPAAQIRWLIAPLYAQSAAHAVIDLPEQPMVRVYLDPYSGEVLGHYSYFNLQSFFRSLHMNLFEMRGFGDYLVAFSGVVVMLSLVAALMFYKRWWQRFLTFRPGRGRALWSEVHKLGGLWSLWFVLVIGSTGVWYLFEMARYDIGDGKVAFAGTGDYALNRIVAEGEGPRLPLDELIGHAQAARPDLQIRQVRPNEGEGLVYVDGQSEHWLVRDRANQLLLNAATGQVIYNQVAVDLPAYWRWSDTADPLHFGDFGTSKLIWFGFGLLFCALILTGIYLHACRLTRGGRSSSSHQWRGLQLALGVTWVITGACVPFGLYQAAQWYGPRIAGVAQRPELAPGVLLFIAVWVTLTVAILAGFSWLLLKPGVRGRIAAV